MEEKQVKEDDKSTEGAIFNKFLYVIPVKCYRDSGTVYACANDLCDLTFYDYCLKVTSCNLYSEDGIPLESLENVPGHLNSRNVKNVSTVVNSHTLETNKDQPLSEVLVTHEDYDFYISTTDKFKGYNTESDSLFQYTHIILVDKKDLTQEACSALHKEFLGIALRLKLRDSELWDSDEYESTCWDSIATTLDACNIPYTFYYLPPINELSKDSSMVRMSSGTINMNDISKESKLMFRRIRSFSPWEYEECFTKTLLDEHGDVLLQVDLKELGNVQVRTAIKYADSKLSYVCKFYESTTHVASVVITLNAIIHTDMYETVLNHLKTYSDRLLKRAKRIVNIED